MIERKFVLQKMREHQIKEYVLNTLGRAGISLVKLQLTPLGERIIVHTSRPGLVVGKEGEAIKGLTVELKKKFELENPQLEIIEIAQPEIDAQLVADRIATFLERYGTKNFKGIMHKVINSALATGARGIEVKISGKLPAARAKSWRVLAGHLKKAGEAAMAQVDRGQAYAQLKPGTIGIQVAIMRPQSEVAPKVAEGGAVQAAEDAQ